MGQSTTTISRPPGYDPIMLALIDWGFTFLAAPPNALDAEKIQRILLNYKYINGIIALVLWDESQGKCIDRYAEFALSGGQDDLDNYETLLMQQFSGGPILLQVWFILEGNPKYEKALEATKHAE